MVTLFQLALLFYLGRRFGQFLDLPVESVVLDTFGSELIGMELPVTVTLKVAQSEPGLRGDTSKAAMKPAILETGLKIQVPLFVGPGEEVRVDTRTGEYVGRA